MKTFAALSTFVFALSLSVSPALAGDLKSTEITSKKIAAGGHSDRDCCKKEDADKECCKKKDECCRKDAAADSSACCRKHTAGEKQECCRKHESGEAKDCCKKGHGHRDSAAAKPAGNK